MSKKKCKICLNMTENSMPIHEKFIGKDMHTVIGAISGVEISTLNVNLLIICQNCAFAIIQADVILEKVRVALGKLKHILPKPATPKRRKTIDSNFAKELLKESQPLDFEAKKENLNKTTALNVISAVEQNESQLVRIEPNETEFVNKNAMPKSTISTKEQSVKTKRSKKTNEVEESAVTKKFKKIADSTREQEESVQKQQLTLPCATNLDKSQPQPQLMDSLPEETQLRKSISKSVILSKEKRAKTKPFQKRMKVDESDGTGMFEKIIDAVKDQEQPVLMEETQFEENSMPNAAIPLKEKRAKTTSKKKKKVEESKSTEMFKKIINTIKDQDQTVLIDETQFEEKLMSRAVIPLKEKRAKTTSKKMKIVEESDGTEMFKKIIDRIEPEPMAKFSRKNTKALAQIKLPKVPKLKENRANITVDAVNDNTETSTFNGEIKIQQQSIDTLADDTTDDDDPNKITSLLNGETKMTKAKKIKKILANDQLKKSKTSKTKVKEKTSHKTQPNFHFHCELCTYDTKVVKYYKKHLIEAHQIEKPSIFKCDKCSKSYQIHAYLQRHIKIVHENSAHIQEKAHICIVCGKSFALIVRLSDHMKKCHSGEVLKDCLNCGMSFRSQIKYDTHVFSEKCKNAIHPCQFSSCNRRFSRPQKMVEHMKKVHLIDDSMDGEIL